MYDHEGFQGSPEPPRPTLFQRLKSFVSSHFTSKATNSAGALEPKERYNDLKIQEAHSVIGALFTIIGAVLAYLMSHDISELVDLRNIDFSSLTFSSAILDIVMHGQLKPKLVQNLPNLTSKSAVLLTNLANLSVKRRI